MKKLLVMILIVVSPALMAMPHEKTPYAIGQQLSPEEVETQWIINRNGNSKTSKVTITAGDLVAFKGAKDRHFTTYIVKIPAEYSAVPLGMRAQHPNFSIDLFDSYDAFTKGKKPSYSNIAANRVYIAQAYINDGSFASTKRDTQSPTAGDKLQQALEQASYQPTISVESDRPAIGQHAAEYTLHMVSSREIDLPPSLFERRSRTPSPRS
ncbi:hypothetical protein M1466_02205 [Candidatus Dependentiae bacterium]|nr:hypothetical protein [Candidatus Dependentiae bacterium]